METETEGKQLASGLTLRRKKQIDYSEAAVAANAVKEDTRSPVRQQIIKRKRKRTESNSKDRPRLVAMEEQKLGAALAATTSQMMDSAAAQPKTPFKVIRPKFRPAFTEFPSLANELDDFEGPKISFTEAGITSFDIMQTGLPCSLCSHRTSTVKELEQHLSRHPENFESCSLCASSNQFTMEGFGEHLLSHFIRESPYLVCLFCNAKISKESTNAVQHLLYHCPSLPSCLLCGDDIEDSNSVLHRRTVHNKLMNRFCCVACLKGFPSLLAFTNHNCMIAYRCVCDISVAYTDREDFEAHLNAADLADDKIHSLLVPDTRTHDRRVYFINIAAIAAEDVEKKDWRSYGFLGIGRGKVKLGPGFDQFKETRLDYTSSSSAYQQQRPMTVRQLPPPRFIRQPQPQPQQPPPPPRFVLTRPRLRAPVVPAPSAPPAPVQIRILRPKAPLPTLSRPKQQVDGLSVSPGVRVITPTMRVPNWLQCKRCDIRFNRIFELSEHMERKHNNDTTVTNMVPVGAMLSICRSCRILFESPTQYRSHMKQHEYSGQYFSNCGCCSLIGSNVAAIRNHQRAQKFWGCYPCRTRFDNERTFFYHVATMKHAKIFFFCKTCNLGCTDIGVVVTHQRSCHGTELGMTILNTLRYRPLDKAAFEILSVRLPLGYNKTQSCGTTCSLFATACSYIYQACCNCLHNVPPSAAFLRETCWYKGDDDTKPLPSFQMFAKAAVGDVILQPTTAHISVPEQYRLPPDFVLPTVRFLHPRAPATTTSTVPAQNTDSSASSEDISPQKRICLAVNAQIDATANAMSRRTREKQQNGERSAVPEVVNID